MSSPQYTALASRPGKLQGPGAWLLIALPVLGTDSLVEAIGRPSEAPSRLVAVRPRDWPSDLGLMTEGQRGLLTRELLHHWTKCLLPPFGLRWALGEKRDTRFRERFLPPGPWRLMREIHCSSNKTSLIAHWTCVD